MSIASEIQRLQGDSSAIASAISAKGVTVPSGSGFDDYASLIASIPTGGGGGATLQSKTASPSTSQQVVTADSGYDGLSQVTISAVTSAIDSNIVAGNIKSGVSILGVTGTYSGGGSVLPYTPLEYIETDGAAYINTGIVATPPRSSEIKLLMGSSGVLCGILCGYASASGSNGKNFALLKMATSNSVIFTYFYNYAGGDGTPSADYSVSNGKPFIVRTTLKKGVQAICVKQDNSSSWSVFRTTQTGSVTSTYNLILFNGYHAGSLTIPAPSGTRLYYCKIYSDELFTQLVFDGVPALYNGQYGLWDNVSNSFKGNSNSSGAFSGA